MAMKLRAMLDYIDRMRPNNFREEDKIRWLNEIEAKIHREVYLTPPDDIVLYQPGGEWKMSGIEFPDDMTMILPEPITAWKYGTVTVEGLETYSANNGAFSVKYVDEEGMLLMKGGLPFPAYDLGPEKGEVTVKTTMDEVSLLLDDIWIQLYYLYVFSRMDLANAEYDRYNNSRTAFNEEWSALKKWYTTHFPNWGCC